MTSSAFPLQWPEGWPRCQRRHPSRYRVSAAKARDDLYRSLALLGAARGSIVLSTNLPQKASGGFYATLVTVEDPGAAVYWTTSKGQPRVMACDRWRKVGENVRAIGLAIDGLRLMQRAGATQILDRAFTAFAALPAAPAALPWWTVLGVSRHAGRDEIERAYREKARLAHPDVGGSTAAMVELNAAREAALWFAEESLNLRDGLGGAR